MVSKTTKGDHFPVRIKIIVHKEPPESVCKSKDFEQTQSGRWTIIFRNIVVEFKNPW